MFQDEKATHSEDAAPENNFDKVKPQSNPKGEEIGNFHEAVELQVEFDVDDEGRVISLDHALNDNPEALAQFLVSQAQTPPKFWLNISAWHSEMQTRTVDRYNSVTETWHTETERYQVNVTEFNFDIDLAQYLLPEPHGPPIWLHGDATPCLRGGEHPQVDNTPAPDGSDAKDLEAQYTGQGRSRSFRRLATPDEAAAREAAETQRLDSGLPIWATFPGRSRNTAACVESDEARRPLRYATHLPNLEGWSDSDLAPPSKTLIEWADEYCRSRKLLKRFDFQKQVYGWDFDALRERVTALVKQNRDRIGGELRVQFILGEDRFVSVRSDSWLSRMTDNACIYFLLWVTLIYPLIIWPFKRLVTSRAEGRWDVAGTSFALTRWVHEPDSVPGQTVRDYGEKWAASGDHDEGESESSRDVIFKQTPLGISRLQGLREGEWYKDWEDAIASNVRYPPPTQKMLRTEKSGFGRITRIGGRGLDGWVPREDPDPKQNESNPAS